MKYLLITLLSMTHFNLFSSQNENKNLLSNNSIFLDKNLGATYIRPNTEIELKNISDPCFYLHLDKRIINFNSTLDYEKMGIEISYLDSNYIYQNKSYCMMSISIIDLFNRYDSYYEFKADFSDSEIESFKYLPQSKIFSLELSENIISIKNISFYYGDNTISINYAYLGSKINDIETNSILPKYCDENISYNLLYSDKINYLESNYGYDLSLGFLKRHYHIVDNKKDILFEINDYYLTSPDDSFFDNSLGSRFFINVNSIDPEISALGEIIIIDNLKPVIEKWNFENINLPIDKLNNIDDSFEEFFCIKDNYSQGNFLQKKITTNIDENISGIYYLFIEVLDQNNNLNNNTFLVNFVDSIPPKISLRYSYIVTSKNNIISSDELLSYFIIEDKESLLSTVVNKNTYQGNELIPGRYIFEIIVTDKKNNSSKALIYIEVRDDDLSNIKNSYRTFYYEYGSKIYLEEIVSILAYEGIIPKNEYSSFRIVEGEDISSILEPGNYYFLVELSFDNNFTYEEFIISITPKNNLIGKKNITILDFFRFLIEEIKNIFNRR